MQTSGEILSFQVLPWSNVSRKYNSIECVEAVFKLLLDLKVIKEDTPLNRKKIQIIGSLGGYFYPDADEDGLLLGTKFMAWFFLVDDVLDSDSKQSEEVSFSPEQEETFIKRIIHVLSTGEIAEDVTPLELFTLDLRKHAQRLCGEERKESFEGWVLDTIEWAKSIIPLNRTMNMKSIDPQVLFYFRKINIGVYPTISCGEVIRRVKLSSSLRNSLVWRSILEETAMITLLCNDIYSYEKESKAYIADPSQPFPCNSLFLLQHKQSLSLEKAFLKQSQVIQEGWDRVNFMLESLKSDSKMNITLDDLKQVEQVIDLLLGQYYWSIECGRYSSPSSPFAELIRNDNRKRIKLNK